MVLENEYVDAAFAALEDHLHLLPGDVQRKVRLAASVRKTHGIATAEELARELGSPKWVIARRTPAIVQRYGEDVVCVTPVQYEAAERRAIEKRVK